MRLSCALLAGLAIALPGAGHTAIMPIDLQAVLVQRLNCGGETKSIDLVINLEVIKRHRAGTSFAYVMDNPAVVLEQGWHDDRTLLQIKGQPTDRMQA